MTKVKKCKCKSEGQDTLHGAGNRVFNQTGALLPTFRCTVCGKEVRESSS
jgi:hypothetical protein